MPSVFSPASYSPAERLARGSDVFDPTIPGGSVGAGVGVCASKATLSNMQKTNEEMARRVFVLFIIIFLRLFGEHCFHDPDLGPLAAIDIGCEVEEFRILSGTGRIKKFLYHYERTFVMLDHSF